MEFLPNENEKVMYLKGLLDSEQILKTQLAFDIHAKKTDLIFLQMTLTDIKSEIDLNNDPNEKLEILNQSIANLRGEMDNLYQKYLSNPASKLSLNGRLTSCIRRLAEQFDGKIDFEPNIINEKGLDQKWELPHYLACSHAIEIVCHYGYRVVNIELLINEKGFQFLVQGENVENIKIDTESLEDRLKNLHGILVWKNGTVNAKTDWKTLIVFTFSIKDKSN